MKQSRDALGLGKSFYLMSGCSGRNGGASALSMMGLYIDRVDVKRRSFNACVYRKSSSCIGM